MSSPTLWWKRHVSSTDSVGTTPAEITLGTVTAGAYSKALYCYSINLTDNGVQHFRLWMNDSVAIVNGTAVSLGSATKTWGIRAKTTDTLVGTADTFNTRGGAWSELAANYKSAPNNSVGNGVSMGHGPNLSLGFGSSVSRYVFLSIQPHVSAYDGEHTGFSFQLGYDFS